jgi:formylglycine-generating enzyme required for sulfatase activity
LKFEWSLRRRREAAVTKHLSKKSKQAKLESKLKPGTSFRAELKDGSQGPEMLVIPTGTFRMGDINGDEHKFEEPVLLARIVWLFAIGRYEVNFEEYSLFAATTGTNCQMTKLGAEANVR